MTMKKWIGVVFIIIGCVLLLLPVVEREQQERKIEVIQDAMAKIENGNEKDVPPEIKKEMNHALMLTIPAIDLKQVVLETTTKENLDKALTQIKENQRLGEGNFAIAGHRSRVHGRHFNRLDELKSEDEIILEDKDYRYTYNVVNKVTVLPSQVEVLDDKPGESLVSLVTCTPINTATHRLIVTGKLIDKQKKDPS